MAQEKADKDKVTIYDVANRAGVAISTVSRVLNDSPDVSAATRAKVTEAIEALAFRPDRTAKNLAQQLTRLLAVAIPTFTTPFHNELLKGIRFCLREQDVDLLLCDLGSQHPQATLLNFLKRGTVDGILVSGVTLNEAITQELRAMRAPVVLIGTPSDQFDAFYWDDVAGAREAVQHLIRQGHRRIGMIRAYTESELQAGRVAGYRQALEAASLPFDPALVFSGQTPKHAGFSEEAGFEAMLELLRCDPPVTAVFVSSDAQAIGARKAVLDSGRRIPEDVALVGYDGIKTSHYIDLSSMDQNMQEIGYRAALLLLERMNGRTGVPHSERIVPTLQVRRSSLFVRS
jgi:LacI family transcriptional regulator